MIAHCKSVYPKEACGLLAGNRNIAEKIYRITNIEKSGISYMMAPEEQFRAMKDMRKNGHEMVAIYHSHPYSQAYPSPKDISLAFYPDAVYLIAGFTVVDNPEVRAFGIFEGDVREVQIESSVDGHVRDELK